MQWLIHQNSDTLYEDLKDRSPKFPSPVQNRNPNQQDLSVKYSAQVNSDILHSGKKVSGIDIIVKH